ncbi:MAG: nucleotidyl transferase AbiEii/AbiGii toxin family protein [Devosia sp.]
MPDRFEPRLEILPAAQRELWNSLAPTIDMRLVLYGGTAIALQLGHRHSIDFDFFGAAALNKPALVKSMPFLDEAAVLQDEPNTLVVSASLPSGPVKLSFFGGLSIGRVGEPRETQDGVMVVASLLDLMVTKLKAILDRAEAKDYVDIAALLRSGLSLTEGLAAFRTLFGGEPAVVLRAIGYFGDGDLSSVGQAERAVLRDARDGVREIPDRRRLSDQLT